MGGTGVGVAVATDIYVSEFTARTEALALSVQTSHIPAHVLLIC